MRNILTPASGIQMGDKNSGLSVTTVVRDKDSVTIGWSTPAGKDKGLELFRETVKPSDSYMVQRA